MTEETKQPKNFGSLWKSRYLGTFASLVLFIFLAPTLAIFFKSRLVLELLYFFIVISSLYAVKQSHRQFYCGLVLAVLGIVFKTSDYFAHLKLAGALGHLCLFGFYVLIVKVILTDLLTLRNISTDSLCEAIVGYLMVGAGFGELYKVVFLVNPEAFNGVAANGADALTYFSLVTLTTLGYGDITPNTDYAKAVVLVEAVIGVFYMAILVSHLVSGISNNSREQL